MIDRQKNGSTGDRAGLVGIRTRRVRFLIKPPRFFFKVFGQCNQPPRRYFVARRFGQLPTVRRPLTIMQGLVSHRTHNAPEGRAGAIQA